MNERINPFARLPEVPAFSPKPRSSVTHEAIDQIAENSNFPSREPVRTAKKPKRKARLHRTGRNENFSIKVTSETRERFYRLADERGVILARLLELALDALESTGPLMGG